MSKLVRVTIHQSSFDILNRLVGDEYKLTARVNLAIQLAGILQSKIQPEKYQVLIDKILAEFD